MLYQPSSHQDYVMGGYTDTREELVFILCLLACELGTLVYNENSDQCLCFCFSVVHPCDPYIVYRLSDSGQCV